MKACTVHAGSMQVAAATLQPRRPSAAGQRSASGSSSSSSSKRMPAPQRNGRHLAVQAAASAAGIEAVGGVRPEIDAAVQQALDQCLTDTDLGMGKKYTASSWWQAGVG
jgi:hypothetical protein